MWMTVYIHKAYEECHIQAGLVLRQTYVSEKYHTQQIQNSHLTQCRGLTTSSYTPSEHADLYSICTVYTVYIYIFFVQYTHISMGYIYF